MWIVGDLSAMNVLLLSVTRNVRGDAGRYLNSPGPLPHSHKHAFINHIVSPVSSPFSSLLSSSSPSSPFWSLKREKECPIKN